MYVPSNSPKWVCYKCRNKIPVPDLETVFAQQLKSFVFSPDAIATHLSEVDSVIVAKRELLATLGRERGEVKDESEKLYRLYLEGGLPVASFRERNDPLEKRKEQLATEIPRLAGEIDFLTIRQLSSSQVLAEAQTLYERWATLTSELKREIVETIVGRITVGQGDIEIDLTCLPHSASPDPQNPHPPTPPSPELVAERERIHKPASLLPPITPSGGLWPPRYCGTTLVIGTRPARTTARPATNTKHSSPGKRRTSSGVSSGLPSSTGLVEILPPAIGPPPA
jgi:site-specific DNA recombinase